jgi:hypothetical protein
MGIKKRHHVVPRFYLKRFANDAEQVVTVHVDDPERRFTASIDKVGVEGHFYNLPTEEGWVTVVEDTLSKLEGIAAHELAKLVAGRSSTLPSFRAKLSFFMAVQFVRGRSPREAITDFYKDIFLKTAQLSTPEIIQAEAERRGEQMSIEEARKVWEFAQCGEYTVGFQKVGPQQLPADSLVNAAEVFEQGEKLIPFFSKRGWILIDFDEPLLLTSDEPVAQGIDSAFPDRPSGLVNADTIVFPLDPCRALMMTHPRGNPPPHHRAKGTRELATAINKLVVARASKQIFFHPNSDPLTELLEMRRTLHSNRG